jgi:hypothetical protein
LRRACRAGLRAQAALITAAGIARLSHGPDDCRGFPAGLSGAALRPTAQRLMEHCRFSLSDGLTRYSDSNPLRHRLYRRDAAVVADAYDEDMRNLPHPVFAHDCPVDLSEVE